MGRYSSTLSSLSGGNQLPLCMVLWSFLSICRVSSSLHLHASGTLSLNKVMQSPSYEGLLGIEKLRTEEGRANKAGAQEVNEASSLCSIHPHLTLSPMNSLRITAFFLFPSHFHVFRPELWGEPPRLYSSPMETASRAIIPQIYGILLFPVV